MKTKFNLQGSERKPLVKAIEELIGRKGKYTMSGSMKYAFDFGEGLALHRDGTLIDEGDIFGLLTGLAERGFTSETEEDEPIKPEVPYYPEQPHEDGENCPEDFREIDELPPMTMREELGLGRERREDFQGENGMSADDVPEPDTLTVEYPLTGFTPETLDNLMKMATAKEALIKAALGAEELPIQQTDEDGGKLRFPWFTLSNPSEAAYYVQFVWALCKTAKEKKRITAKERGLADNPKYAMRCWLLSLGLIGNEYKNARKLLLARLGGNSSFKGGSRPTYTAHLYTYPNGSEEDAMDCDTQEFTSLAKAKACCDGFLADCESLKFAGAHVEGDNGDWLYEILTDGTVNEK